MDGVNACGAIQGHAARYICTMVILNNCSQTDLNNNATIIDNLNRETNKPVINLIG